MNLKEEFAGQNVLITGGMGFIGSNLAHRLIEFGARVTIMDILDPDTGANLQNIIDIRDQVEFIKADIRDDAQTRFAVKDKKFLFNLAGQGSHLGSIQDPVKDLDVNGMGQLKLLLACHRYNPEIRIIYPSTRQVYGRTQYTPVDEFHPLVPVDYNGVSKHTGAMYHLTFNNIYGMWTTILRMTNVYGPRMRIRDSRLTFIGCWFKYLLLDMELDVYGDGQQIRDLNYVEDVIDAMLLSVTNPAARGRIYNLGGAPVHLVDLAQLLIEINGGGRYKLVPFPDNRKRIDIGDYFGDYSQIQNELGWEPKIDVDEGVKKLFEWVKENKNLF